MSSQRNERTPPSERLPQAIKPADLLREELPQDWSAEERLLFNNWLRQIVSLGEMLGTTAADRPKVLWRAAKIHKKLNAAFVRAALIVERRDIGEVREVRDKADVKCNQLQGRID